MKLLTMTGVLALSLGATVACAGDVDSDGDGLSDAKELELGTSPNDPDTDRDGVFDGQECEDHTDPRDPNDFHHHDGDHHQGREGLGGADGGGHEFGDTEEHDGDRFDHDAEHFGFGGAVVEEQHEVRERDGDFEHEGSSGSGPRGDFGGGEPDDEVVLGEAEGEPPAIEEHD